MNTESSEKSPAFAFMGPGFRRDDSVFGIEPMTRAVTPADLTITPRDRRFGRGMTQDRWWMGGDPVATAFYNALCATFPKGEGFFVEAVPPVPRRRGREARRRDQGLHHPGGDAQPRACAVQPPRAGGGLRSDGRSRSGSTSGSRSPAPSRRSSASRRRCAWSISPRSSPTSCCATRAISAGADPESARDVALARDRGDRA